MSQCNYDNKNSSRKSASDSLKHVLILMARKIEIPVLRFHCTSIAFAAFFVGNRAIDLKVSEMHHQLQAVDEPLHQEGESDNLLFSSFRW